MRSSFSRPGRLGWDVGQGAVGLDASPDVVGVIALVAVEDVSRRQALQKLFRRLAVRDLAAGEHERDGAAEAIGQGMDLGRSPAARTPNRLLALPPLAPEAERCAFTAELSMSTCAGGPPARASAWNRSTHTPFAAQRT